MDSCARTKVGVLFVCLLPDELKLKFKKPSEICVYLSRIFYNLSTAWIMHTHFMSHEVLAYNVVWCTLYLVQAFLFRGDTEDRIKIIKYKYIERLNWSITVRNRFYPKCTLFHGRILFFHSALLTLAGKMYLRKWNWHFFVPQIMPINFGEISEVW